MSDFFCHTKKAKRTITFNLIVICRVNDDDDPELIRAINESKCAESTETNEQPAATTSVIDTNGTQKQLYVVKDENAYNYPKVLLDRVLKNKRKNYDLESELLKLKRVCNELRQENLTRRLQSATISETIELS